MYTNLNLLINLFLLAGVLLAIRSVIKSRRQSQMIVENRAAVSDSAGDWNNDDIISVRKIASNTEKYVRDLTEEEYSPDKVVSLHEEDLLPVEEEIIVEADEDEVEDEPEVRVEEKNKILVMFLLAKNQGTFAGYELLQTLLAAGLRYGENSLFHRYQFANGKGAVMCSLAAATDEGTFDMQNMGAFEERGLVLFMKLSGNTEIDAERFSLMLETAENLKEGLDCHLLDDTRRPLDELALARYYQAIE